MEKVTGIELKNMLGLTLTVPVNSNILTITGPNGRGKSRLLTALLATLAPSTLTAQQKALLADDDNDSEVVVNLTNWVLKLERVKGKPARLTITNKKTGKNGGKNVIDQFLGKNFVNIGAFLAMDSNKKTELLLKSYGLAEQYESLKATIKTRFDERRQTGQLRDAFTVNIAVPVDRVDITEIYQRSRDKEILEASLQQQKDDIAIYTTQVEFFEKQLKEAKERLNTTQNNYNVITEKYNLVREIDYKKQLEDAKKINAQADTYDRVIETNKQRATYEAKYNALTIQIEALRKEAKELLASIDLPVKGLEFDVDKGLLYKGFSVWSDGEARSIAFQLAKSLKGDLPIAIFENFSLLDTNAQNAIKADCETAGFQLFCEMVRDTPLNNMNEFFIEENPCGA